jgi:uncharacterized protein YndB with AHSA1/START domain
MAENQTDHPQRIERSIEIHADLDKVWELVSQPAWWINDGTVVDHRIERDGDLSIVHDDVHGIFHLRTVHLDRPRYAAFRWLSRDGGGDLEEATLVEFWITAGPEGRVTVRVVESDFDRVPGSDAERRRQIEDNTEGWTVELDAARAFLST